MKSPEVYAVLRKELGPLLKSLGFKREKALLSWSRQHGGQHTVLWCQVSRDGWDDRGAVGVDGPRSFAGAKTGMAPGSARKLGRAINA